MVVTIDEKDKECMKNGHLEIGGLVDYNTGLIMPDQKTLIKLL